MKCPQHVCTVCDGRAASRGGLLFRCTDCPTTVCETCLPDSFHAVDRNEVAAVLGYVARSIEYIRCSACFAKPPNALYCRMHGISAPPSQLVLQSRTLNQHSFESGGSRKGALGGRGKGRQTVKTDRSKRGKEDFVVISDEEVDALSAKLESGAHGQSQEQADISKFGAVASTPMVTNNVGNEESVSDCGAASVLASPPRKSVSPSGGEGRKRRLESEAECSRPARRCAVLGADARLARQLQESRLMSLQAGASTVSPKKGRAAPGQALGNCRPAGSDGQGEYIDLEAQESAWSSAQTPTTPVMPAGRSQQSVRCDAPAAALAFPCGMEVQGLEGGGAESVAAALEDVVSEVVTGAPCASPPSVLVPGIVDM